MAAPGTTPREAARAEEQAADIIRALRDTPELACLADRVLTPDLVPKSNIWTRIAELSIGEVLCYRTCVRYEHTRIFTPAWRCLFLAYRHPRPT